MGIYCAGCQRCSCSGWASYPVLQDTAQAIIRSAGILSCPYDAQVGWKSCKLISPSLVALAAQVCGGERQLLAQAPLNMNVVSRGPGSQVVMVQVSVGPTDALAE